MVDFSAENLPHVRPITSTSKSKQAIYQPLKRALEGGELTLPRGDEDADRLYRELTNLEYSFTSNDLLRVEHRPGEHADLADALAFAVYGWKQAEQRRPRRRSRRGMSPRQRSRVRS